LTHYTFPPFLDFNVLQHKGDAKTEERVGLEDNELLRKISGLIDDLDEAPAAPEEPKTYLAMILEALYEFYLSVLDWIDYLTPSYFKSAAQEPEQPSALRSNSFLSLNSSIDEDNDTPRKAASV